MKQVRALLLTDIVDSTHMAARLGDDAAAALWARHDRMARDLLPLHHGREIDKTDGFLLMFDRAVDAAAYVQAYHRAVEGLGMAARAGLHVGPVVLRENSPADIVRGAKPLEVEGLAKPTAARAMGLAVGGQTLLTAEAAEALSSTTRRVQADPDGSVPLGAESVLLSHGHWMLKGLVAPVELFELGVPGDAPMAPPPDTAKAWRVVWRNEAWVPLREVEHSLPRERDAFVGRESDLQELARLLDEGAALVSVLGIGGTGKTRLVTHYGWTWLGSWPGGVWFCDLSEARGVDGIVFAVARALDVPLGKGDPVDQLGHAIAARGRCLVLLDNFEQITRHAPETVGCWLDLADEAQFVVTTREVLGLPGETSLALPPLREAEAIALFSARAVQAKRDFELSQSDGPIVSKLVRLLDCLPLAIELAAARVRVMQPAMLLDRMSQRFKLLASSGGRRDRQATLRAALDWSWDLLSEAEKAALAQVSIFEGGFTLDAAEVVLDLSAWEDAPWPMDAVQSLVDKSLVRGVGGGRFDMLVSVQEYAAEKLSEGLDAMPAPAMRLDAETRHGEHHAALGADGAIESLHTSGGTARRETITVELDNLVAATRRACARRDGATAAGTLEALWAVLMLRGPFKTAGELARQVLAIPGLGPEPSAHAHRVLAEALSFSGFVPEGVSHAEQAVAMSRELGDRRHECLALLVHGELLWTADRLDDAAPILEQALSLARTEGNRRFEAWSLNDLGLIYFSRDIPKSVELLEAALEVARQADLPYYQTMPMNNLANTHWDWGLDQVALEHWQASIDICQQLGDRKGAAICTGNIGHLHRHRGRLVLARDHLERALATCREIGFLYGQPYWLYNLALANVAEGRLDDALALAEEAARIGAPFPHVLAEALTGLARVYVARGEQARARTAIERAKGCRQEGQVGALVAATDAFVAASSGDALGAASAIDRATADETLCRPGTEVGVLVALARGHLANADGHWIGGQPAEA